MERVICTNNKLHFCRCKNCNALVTYENEDLECRPLDTNMKYIVKYISYINCPNCYEEIIIDNIKKE